MNTFDLSITLATFQHFVNGIFKDILDQFAVIYEDDTQFLQKPDTGQPHIQQVLKCLRANDLCAKPEKNEFDHTTNFLGYVILPDGIST